MRFEKALVIGLMATLTACGSLPKCPTMPAMPTKPTLPSIRVTFDGGIVLDRKDTEAISVYILELERGYQ